MRLKKINKDNYLTILQISIFLIFVFIAIGFVFSRGVCCGDDAVYAKVAKNLANSEFHNSKSLLTMGSSWGELFDPRLGSGLTLILPATIIIKLVGNTYWAPGIAVVSLWSTLLLFIGITLKRMNFNNKNYTISLFVFFLFSYLLMTYHFEQWYALLGEIPAAFLLILAILIIYINDSKIAFFASGFLFSLACNSKLLTFLPFATFLIVFTLLNLIDNRKGMALQIKLLIPKLSILILGFVIPFLLIEIWKIAFLGIQGYVNYWTIYKNLIFGLGLDSSNTHVLQSFFERVLLLQNRFGIFLPSLLPVIILGGVLLRKQIVLFKIYCTLSSIVLINSIYWLFFSIGWPRYYIISLIIIILVLALPFLSNKLVSHRFLFYILLLLVFTSQSWGHITFPFNNLDKKLFTPSTNLDSLLKVANILNKNNDFQIITQHWSTGIDLEYIIKSNKDFTTINDPSINLNDPFIFVANTKFLFQPDEKLETILEKCDIENIGQYMVGECN